MKRICLSIFLTIISLGVFSQSTVIKYLSGTDKDHTVPWDFFCSGGRNSGKWTKIAVPSNWELQGFGAYNYGHDKVKANEQGLYKYEFFSESWKGKRVFIVFEGSMTDTKVLINGKEAGPVHQGSFYRFKYDITGLLKSNGKNLLEVTVSKTSANASVNDAERKNSDFWVFGGIFRPVYLEIVPTAFIDRLAINATAGGSFQMDVYAQGLTGNETIEARVEELNGASLGKPFSIRADSSEEYVRLKENFVQPLLWSAEFPHLYQVIVTLKNRQGIVHQIRQKFGFRTVELRKNDGFYVNGAKIMLKGACRHSFWPETGRTLSYPVHLQDVRLIKEMNMNAVRMSHYPPDREFLDICDSLGLYVLDELTGWQAKYDTIVGHKLVKELVIRDVNHPSILFWDNGNEGGWNRALDNDYDVYDPQGRTVLHPSEKFNGTDTHHYPDYNYIVKASATGQEVFFPTEFLHGLYDGGAGAGLEDFWNVMIRHPHGAGGFIWALLDEAVVRTDKGGILDGDGNHAPDGIVGPHREKEGSFYAIKEIWSPVYIDPKTVATEVDGSFTGGLDSSFTGKIPVENRYDFTDLSQCTFLWKLVVFPSPQDKGTAAIVQASGIPAPLTLGPGGKGSLNLSLPSSWWKNDALYLTASGPDKKEICTWSWAIRQPGANNTTVLSAMAKKSPFSSSRPSAIGSEQADSSLIVKCDGVKYYFDTTTGYIAKVVKPAGTVSLSGGPVLAGVGTSLKQFSHNAVNGQYIVEADYQGAGSLHVKWTFTPGQAVKLEYRYAQEGDADFMGITFNYPEEKITGMKWLGRGPYRVWKNRLNGQQFGVWQKKYNNTVTGETWNYPEFKGYHAELNWVLIENKESPFTIYTAEKNLYLQMLHPDREKDALKNNNVEPPFPAGNIGFLNAIAPIGTKFHAAAVMGPQGKKNQADGHPVSATLWFDFIH